VREEGQHAGGLAGVAGASPVRTFSFDGGGELLEQPPARVAGQRAAELGGARPARNSAAFARRTVAPSALGSPASRMSACASCSVTAAARTGRRRRLRGFSESVFEKINLRV
jgi:hypothetical protein